MHSNTLLLDIGNTNLKWAWLAPEGLGEVRALPHAGLAPAAILAAIDADRPRPAAVHCANVAGAAMEQALTTAIQARWGLTPTFVRAEARAFGVTSGYRDPTQLGVDRWLALIAVYNRHQRAACIADCGTAATLDAITGDGRHLGGLILPGLGLMRRALLDHTRIPRVGDDPFDGWAADHTAAAVAAGGVRALASSIAEMARWLGEGTGEAPLIVLCGSDAPRLLPLLGHLFGAAVIEARDLVLDGLAHYAQPAHHY